MKASLLLVLILVAVAAAVLAFWLFPNRARRRLQQAAPRHWVLRVLGAVWLLGTLAAIGWFTWRDHAPGDGGGSAVLTPTLPLKPLPAGEEYGQVDPGPCQLIISLVLLDEASRLPLWGTSEVCRWPEDQGREIRIDASPAGVSCDSRFEISNFMRMGRDRGLTVQGRMRMQGNTWSRSGGMGDAMEMIHLEGLGFRLGGMRHPLGIVPRNKGRLLVAYCISRAEAGDPLRPVPLGEWLAAFPPEQIDGEVDRFGGGSYGSADTPPGARMLSYVGPAAFLLLLAAIAGAQCFRWRGIAFTGLLAGMVLFAGGLDYAVMRMHAARALDENLNPDLRRAAFHQADQTFFHQAAARRLLGEVAGPLLKPGTGRGDPPERPGE